MSLDLMTRAPVTTVSVLLIFYGIYFHMYVVQVQQTTVNFIVIRGQFNPCNNFICMKAEK